MRIISVLEYWLAGWLAGWKTKWSLIWLIIGRSVIVMLLHYVLDQEGIHPENLVGVPES